jgi:ATP-dependent Clp protease ATP-binding subunit ClpA
MAIPSEMALLLDYARAEAKRRGHGEVVLAHVAAALSGKDSGQFTATFGADAEPRLRSALERLPPGSGPVADAPELGELLAKVAAGPDPRELLNEAIRDLLRSDPASVPTPAAHKASAGQHEPAVAPALSHAEVAPSTTHSPAPIDKALLLRQLKSRIVGQDEALEAIVDRLALTRMQFDLRPSRPDGVFLVAGPSGTGKSALARALAEHLFGDEGRLISLDMSEYAHDWAVSRLIGPQPGYVGSDRPDGWLTTRVRRQPDSLILLDEIEKSHPTVWNTFLQVFNDGRLTDGQGKEADFSRAVIVMTSNLGSENFRRRHRIGFHTDDTATADLAELTLDAVKQAMPPEFINRLDAVVVLNPLTPDVIREIAGREIAGAMARLRERGYETEVPANVVAFVAENSYEPAYGARHLQRSIERHLLQTLLNHPPSKLRATVANEEVSWVPVPPAT